MQKYISKQTSVFLGVHLLDQCSEYGQKEKSFLDQIIYIKWALTRENLSSWTKRVSNQSPQLQRLARKLKFHQ